MGGRQSERRGPRPIFVLALALVLLAAGGFGAFSLLRERWQHALEKRRDPVRERNERAQPAAAIALAPLPVKSPLVERPGKDAFGYPLSYVDGGALLSLLGRGKYAELSAYLEQLERDFEADFHDEYWIVDASDAFGSPNPELDPAFDAWLHATPDSFAPYLGRAVHRVGAGWAARGTDWAGQTDRGNFVEMHKAFELARADLARALELNPRVVAAVRVQMRMAFADGSRAELDKLATAAFKLCPACLQPRITQQVALEPRWGGSYQEMEKAARAAPVSQNSRLRLLAGYQELDRAHVATSADKLAEALQHAQLACAFGPNADFLEQKADILARQGDAPGAVAALSSALELRPGRADLLLARARAESAKGGDWRACYRDLVAGMRIDPAAADARDVLPYAVKGLTFLGWQAHTQGKEDEAIQLLDQAAELDPNRDVEGRRVAVLTAGFHGTDAEIAQLDAAARAAPHDFYAHERLDYALSTRRDWPRIAAMWGAYLQDNPDDARAYLERSGTFQNQGRNAEAHADAQRACELGSSAGCAYAKRP
jgi:tetratricopeptide (TPR) repeat protein